MSSLVENPKDRLYPDALLMEKSPGMLGITSFNRQVTGKLEQMGFTRRTDKVCI